MNNVIDYEEKRLDKELEENLEKIERRLPTLQMIIDDQNDILGNYNLQPDAADYYDRVKALLLSSYDKVCVAYNRLSDEKTKMAAKHLKKRMHEFDVIETLFEDYVSDSMMQPISDEPIPEIDVIVSGLDLRYKAMGEDELKNEMPKYIKASKDIYHILFHYLETEKNYHVIYAYFIFLSQINYYPFLQYLTITKKDWQR